MYCLRHRKKKGRYVSKNGDFCGLDTDKIMWHDAWITVSEAELKRPEVEAVSAIQIIKELQEEKTMLLSGVIGGASFRLAEHAVEENEPNLADGD